MGGGGGRGARDEDGRGFYSLGVVRNMDTESGDAGAVSVAHMATTRAHTCASKCGVGSQ